MATEGIAELLKSVTCGDIPQKQVAVVKDIPPDVPQETLTNFLEVVSGQCEVDKVCKFDEINDLAVVMFASEINENLISEKLKTKTIKNKRVTVTVLEMPTGVIIRNVPNNATDDTLLFYFEKVLRNPASDDETVTSSKIYREIDTAVVLIAKDLPVVFKKEPHKVCGETITVEPYVPSIHDPLITALQASQSENSIQTKVLEQQSQSILSLKNIEEKSTISDKSLTLDCSLASSLSASFVTDVENLDEDDITPQTPSGTGNLRIFFSGSDGPLKNSVNSSMKNDAGRNEKLCSIVSTESFKLDENNSLFSKRDIPNIFSPVNQPNISETLENAPLSASESIGAEFGSNLLKGQGHRQDHRQGHSQGHIQSRKPNTEYFRKSGNRELKTDLDYSNEKQKVVLLEMGEFTNRCQDCKITLDSNKGIVVLRGSDTAVQKAKLAHFEILHSVEKRSVPISPNMFSVLNQDESKVLVKDKLRSGSVKSLVMVTDGNQLQAQAFNIPTVKEALHIIQSELLKKEVQYNESHFKFLNGSAWKSLVDSLEKSNRHKVKVEVIRGQKKIVVEGWKLAVHQTVTDIQQVLKDNCQNSSSAKLSGGEAKCFKAFIQDKQFKDIVDYARKHNVNVKVKDINGGHTIAIEIKGQDDNVKIVETKVQQIVSGIWNGQLDFGRISKDDSDQAMISKSLRSEGGKKIIKNFEDVHKCIVEVNEGQRELDLSSFEFTPSASADPPGGLTKSASLPDLLDKEQIPWEDDNLPSPVFELEEDAMPHRWSENPQPSHGFASRAELGGTSMVESRKFGNTMISIKQGSITYEVADVLVNVVPSPSLRVQDSNVYKAFVDAGGWELEQYFQSRKDDVDRNVVYTQAGGKLKCQYVFHLLMEKWKKDSDSARKNLLLALQSCFQWCKSLGSSTISFPAVGVGKYLGYPPNIVAQCMISESVKVTQQQDNSIKEITFVIYDQGILPLYTQAIKQANTSTGALATMARGPYIPPPRPAFMLPSQTEGFDPRDRDDIVTTRGYHDNPSRQRYHAKPQPMRSMHDLFGLPNRRDRVPHGMRRSRTSESDVGPQRRVSVDEESYASHHSRKPEFHKQNPKSRHSSGHQRGRYAQEHGEREKKDQYPPHEAKRPRDSSPDVPLHNRTKIKLVSVVVFAESKPAGEQARSTLSKEIKAEFLAEDEIKDGSIKHMSKDSKKKIFDIDACKQRRVIVNINADKGCIMLKGAKDDINSTSKEIFRVLLKQSSSPPKERTPRPDTKGTKEYYINLSEDPPTPKYWKHFKDGQSLLDTLRSIVHLPRGEKVDVDKKTYDAIVKLVEKTWRQDVVGHGKDAVGLSHKTIRVTKIKRIENYDLYKKYSMKRGEMFMQKSRAHGNINSFLSLENITQTSKGKGPVQTTRHIDKHMLSDIYSDINEHYLFHGTPDDVVENIATKGLDFRHSSDDGMFGPGTYAAESATKADQYADPKNKRQTHGRKMLLMRMLLGNIYVSKTDKKFKKPPCQCLELNCKNAKHHEFDSIVGDGKWNFREFVVYSMEQCYPEYLITYDRM